MREGETNRRLPDVVTIAALAVAIGLLPLPYGYYMLLRLFLCGVCFYCLTVLPRVRDGEKWILTGLVVLYNPVFPIELGSKPFWSIINVGTVIWLWFLYRRAG
jgi:Family of unknown function (DUF6804)